MGTSALLRSLDKTLNYTNVVIKSLTLISGFGSHAITFTHNTAASVSVLKATVLQDNWVIEVTSDGLVNVASAAIMANAIENMTIASLHSSWPREEEIVASHMCGLEHPITILISQPRPSSPSAAQHPITFKAGGLVEDRHRI